MDEDKSHIKIANWMREMERKSTNRVSDEQISSFQAKQLICSKNLERPLLYLARHLYPPDHLLGTRLHLQNAQIRMGIINGNCNNYKENSHNILLSNCRANLLAETQELFQLDKAEEALRAKERDLLLQIKIRHQSLYKARVEIEQMRTWSKEIKVLTELPPSKDSARRANSKTELLAIIKNVKQMRMELLKEEGNLSHFHNRNIKAWSKLADIMTMYNPSLLYEAFSSISSDAFVTMRKKSQDVDLVKDALDLCLYNHDSDMAVEEKESHSMSTKTNLLQMDANHLHIRVKSHNRLCSVKSASAALNVLKDKLAPRTNEFYGQGSITEQICKLEKSRILLVGMKEALAKASVISLSMEKDLEFAKITQQNLLQHYIKVQNFEKDTRKNVVLTKCLVMASSSAWGDLDLNQQAIYDCVEKSVNCFKNLSYPSTVYYLNVFNVFSKIPLIMIKSEAICENKRAILNSLSPCNLHQFDESRINAMSSVLSQWVFIFEMLRQNKRMKSHLDGLIYMGKREYDKMLTRCKDNHQVSSSHIKGICKRTLEQDKQLETKVGPLLEYLTRNFTINQKELHCLKSVANTWFRLLGNESAVNPQL